MRTIDDHFLFFSRSISPTHVLLDAEEASHMIAVLRAKEGTEVRITNGEGLICTCVIESIMKKSTSCRILSREIIARPLPQITCYIGLPEKDAFESALELLIPLGVAAIVPLEMRYCQKKWWEKKWDDCVERFDRKAIAALKQSTGAWLPAIPAPQPFAECDFSDAGLLLHADRGGVGLWSLSRERLAAAGKIAIVVGPPGGFAEDETDALARAGSTTISLADLRLRTELAAVAACANLRGLLQN